MAGSEYFADVGDGKRVADNQPAKPSGEYEAEAVAVGSQVQFKHNSPHHKDNRNTSGQDHQVKSKEQKKKSWNQQ